MKITALFVQRNTSYAGEYAPELHDAVDEFTDDENPHYLQGKVSEVIADLGPGKAYASYALIDLEVDTTVVENALGLNRPSTITTATPRG